MARPSILAVGRLMISSNFDDCTTGKSVVFAALRMRPVASAARERLRPALATVRDETADGHGLHRMGENANRGVVYASRGTEQNHSVLCAKFGRRLCHGLLRSPFANAAIAASRVPYSRASACPLCGGRGGGRGFGGLGAAASMALGAAWTARSIQARHQTQADRVVDRREHYGDAGAGDNRNAVP
jgi:hypothetical protein